VKVFEEGLLPEVYGLTRRLLDLVQVEFPAVPRPYAQLARRLGLEGPGGEAVVLEELDRLRAGGIVRRVGGVFDSRALGFATTLAAARVPPERLEAVAEAVNAYPEVTHNYAREGPLNLWFTLVARDRGRIQAILDELRAATGVEFLEFPAGRVFKSRVVFRFGDDREERSARRRPRKYPRVVAPAQPKPAGVFLPAAAAAAGPPPSQAQPDDVDRSLIRVLQGDLPGGLYPFREVATQIGLPHGEVLARISAYRRRGWLRRLAAVVAHRRAGLTANAMAVWEVPEDRLAEAGRAVSALPEVTHCYSRAPAPGWPYRLYAMVHGSSREECLAVVRRASQAAGLSSRRVLFSLKEYKKTSPLYY